MVTAPGRLEDCHHEFRHHVVHRTDSPVDAGYGQGLGQALVMAMKQFPLLGSMGQNRLMHRKVLNKGLNSSHVRNGCEGIQHRSDALARDRFAEQVWIKREIANGCNGGKVVELVRPRQRPAQLGR